MNRAERRQTERSAKKVQPLVVKKRVEDIKLDSEDLSVLQDFQLGINHLQAAMGRYLGHVGVKKYGLKKGQNYGFEPKWINGTVEVYETRAKVELAK